MPRPVDEDPHPLGEPSDAARPCDPCGELRALARFLAMIAIVFGVGMAAMVFEPTRRERPASASACGVE